MDGAAEEGITIATHATEAHSRAVEKQRSVSSPNSRPSVENVSPRPRVKVKQGNNPLRQRNSKPRPVEEGNRQPALQRFGYGASRFHACHCRYDVIQ
jgi:hypothetical protein